VIQHVALTDRFTDAVAYAAVAHADQVRKGTEVPYLAHLLSVAALVLEHGGDEPQATAGVLHDVVEDCGGQRRLEDVRVRFGADIADLVAALSDAAPADGESKAPWRERKEAYLEHLRELARAGHPAVLVSLCDKLHNARAIVADATDPDGPGPAVWGRFKADADEVAWYYRSLREVYDEAEGLPTRAVHDLGETVGALTAVAEQASTA
jgi:(p)ppGpp synthase/HD superfamily hydrolase